jgi:hypothetical protein
MKKHFFFLSIEFKLLARSSLSRKEVQQLHAVYTIERAVIDMPGKVDAEETETARPQIIAF